MRFEVPVRHAHRIQSISCVMRADVFARLMVGTIAGRSDSSIVRLQVFVVSRGVSFIRFTTRVNLAKSLLAPESQPHQAGHVKRSHTGGDESD